MQALAHPYIHTTPSLKYLNWDGDRISTCLCDAGYAGPDCSEALCPYGDMLETTGQQRRTIRIVLQTPTYADYVFFRFQMNSQTTNAINLLSFTSETCTEMLATGGFIDAENSSCRVATQNELSSVDGTTILHGTYEATISITFSSIPARSSFNPAWNHDGNPPVEAFSCYPDDIMDPLLFATVTCTVEDVLVQNIELIGDPFIPLPTPDFPVGTYYELVVADVSTFPNKVTVTRVLQGLGPHGTDLVTELSPVYMDLIGVIFDPVAGAWAKWDTLSGHTLGARWWIGGKPGPLGTDVTTTILPTIREFLPCSGAGACDMRTGQCHCGPNHAGIACEVLTNTIVLSKDEPVLDVVSDTADYDGNILNIRSIRPLGSPDFNYIAVSDHRGEPFFSLSGDGTLNGLHLDFTHGAEIGGGLVTGTAPEFSSMYPKVSPLSVYYGDMHRGPDFKIPTAAIHSEYPFDSADALDHGPILDVSARPTLGVSTPESAFSVLQDGTTTVYKGLSVNNGMEVHTGGVDLLDGGLRIKQGGMSITGNFVHMGYSSINGNMYVNGFISVASGNPFYLADLYVPGYSSLGADVDVYGKLTVETGGIEVELGGINVQAGGINVETGGLTIEQGGLHVQAGVSQFDQPVDIIDGGLSIRMSSTPGFHGNPAVQAYIGTEADRTAAFFMDAPNTAYAGGVVTIKGPDITKSGAYNLLEFYTFLGAHSLVVTKLGDILSSDSLVISTANLGPFDYTTSSAVSLTTGQALGPAATSGDAHIRTGVSQQGDSGSIYIVPGTSETQAGHVSIAGGVSSQLNGGDIYLHPGNGLPGLPQGSLIVKEPAGNPQITIDPGVMHFSPTTGTMSLTAAQNLAARAQMVSVSGQTAIVLRGGNGVGANGGTVSLVGGNGLAGFSGGNVEINAGIGFTGSPGHVRISSAGLSASVPRLVVNENDMKILRDTGNAIVDIQYNDPADFSQIHVSADIVTDGFVQIAGFTFTDSLLVSTDSILFGALDTYGATNLHSTLDVFDAAHIHHNLYVEQKLTVNFDGVDIKAGNLVVEQGSLSVSQGAVIQGLTTDIKTPTLNVVGLTSIGGPLHVASQGASLRGGLSVYAGDTLIQNTLSVMGYVANQPNYIHGDLSIYNNLHTTGKQEFYGKTFVRTMVSLHPLATIESDGGGLILRNSGHIEVGTEIINHGYTSLGADLDLFGNLRVKDNAFFDKDIHLTAGDIYLDLGSVHLLGPGASLDVDSSGSFGGHFSVAGNTHLTGNMYIDPGTVHLSTIEGSPVVIQGRDYPGGSMPGGSISIFGGSSHDERGGHVVIKPGRDGVAVPVEPGGSISLLHWNEDAHIAVHDDGIHIKAAGSSDPIHMEPAITMDGWMHMNGASSVLGSHRVDGMFESHGSAEFHGTLETKGPGIHQKGEGSIRFDGYLTGSGYLDTALITVCTPTDWLSSGVCYQIKSVAPTHPLARAKIYWNMDSVAQDVDYDGIIVSIAPGALFPVYEVHTDIAWR